MKSRSGEPKPADTQWSDKEKAFLRANGNRILDCIEIVGFVCTSDNDDPDLWVPSRMVFRGPGVADARGFLVRARRFKARRDNGTSGGLPLHEMLWHLSTKKDESDHYHFVFEPLPDNRPDGEQIERAKDLMDEVVAEAGRLPDPSETSSDQGDPPSRQSGDPGWSPNAEVPVAPWLRD